MRIGPDSDQKELRDAMRDVLTETCPPALVRACHTDPQAWQGLWKTAQQLGWTSLAQCGQRTSGNELGLTHLDLALAAETCGQALAPIPFISSIGMAAGAVRAVGAPMSDLLDEIAQGSVAVLAVQPAGQRLPGVPMVIADNRIRGEAQCVPDATHAQLVLTLASDGRTVSLVALRDEDEFTVIPAESADPSRPLATVHVDAQLCHAPKVDVESVLSPALLAVGAELVGVAQGALELAVAHARTRTQFGRPIGSYQGVKHALADGYVAIERARSLTYMAAAGLDDPATPSDSPFTTCALAKAAAGDAALRSVRTTIQVLGALGQTWEHDAHLYLRRAWVGAAQLGDSSSLYHLAGRRHLQGVAS